MTGSDRDLLLSNLLTLVMAVVFDWPIGWLLWPFWIQSVVIGWYARKRMLALRDFSTEGFTANNAPVPETEDGKRSTAAFFALHYGAFHAFYLAFLCMRHLPDGWRDAAILAGCGVSFILSQRRTWAAQHAADLLGRPNLGALMFLPYLRVVPMHLMVFAVDDAAATLPTLLLVIALKTASDLLLDHADRRIAASGAARAAARRAQPPDPPSRDRR
ncbi:DUF6498-containing protein [Luteimonas sp. BDR2-5]|uniref:DUF6498-containing protein n=1 Tax=Proluteimonas luteida TaxID=2878685 RepID=UPI001E5D19C6|nr:DUF6498-containing protein [Luteimonas sp. BDR2-5]MCD9028862.1 DUF6498-containing protein [Luteimonas sp. BDR2-5]